MAAEGDQAMKDFVVRMQDINKEMETLSKIIENLRDRSQNIEGIVIHIKDIASQINILSLNALIEASRSGEAGRGFTIVANRVRDLASQSDQLAKHIEQAVETIQSETEKVTQMVKLSSLEYNEGIKLALSAEILFREIKLKTGSVASEVVEASENMDEIYKLTQDIVRSINKVSDHSNQSMQETHQVMAATEEQFASMLELASKATKISEMASNLKSLTNRFKV
jgi:methyl-accepting chemotaxis protein